jgi:hypothetical protein
VFGFVSLMIDDGRQAKGGWSGVEIFDEKVKEPKETGLNA